LDWKYSNTNVTKLQKPEQLLMMYPPRNKDTTTAISTTTREKLNISAFMPDKEVMTGEAILKRSVKEMAHSHPISDVLMSSNTLTSSDGSQVPHQRLDDLCEIWSKHLELVQQFWNIIIKRYEDIGEWEVKFQRLVMDQMNLEYVADDSSMQTLAAETKDSEGNVINCTH
jgi:hypothetical protein